MRNSMPVVSLAVAMTVLSLSACAGTSFIGPRNQVLISVSDLDLNSENGAKNALQRIERAATKACGGQPTFNSFTGALDGSFYECREVAVRQVIGQLNAPRLALVYQDLQAHHGQ